VEKLTAERRARPKDQQDARRVCRSCYKAAVRAEQSTLELFKGTVRVLGRRSPDALYSNDPVSFDSDTLDQCHARSASRTISGSRRRECHIPCSSWEK
jgi:hypothetical protein